MNKKYFFSSKEDLCALLLGWYLSELLFPLGEETGSFDYFNEHHTSLDLDLCNEEN